MAHASMSYQTKDFGEKVIRIPRQNLWSQFKSINLQPVPTEVNVTVRTVCTPRVHGEYRIDLDSIGTMEFRTVVLAQWWWVMSRAAHGCWRAPQCSLIPTNSLGHGGTWPLHCVYKLTGLWNCRQLPSSPPGCPLAPCLKVLLCPQVLSVSQLGDPRAATSATSSPNLQS